MTNGATDARRRETIRTRIGAGQLPAALKGEEPTWIPTSYPPGGKPAPCHYCGESIRGDEALLMRDEEQCHPGCEESWRDLVTGERGEEPADRGTR